jgi:hypothetical protein
MSGNISPDAVQALAYRLWQDRGGTGGSPEEDWFRAEEILGAASDGRHQAEKMDQAAEESFPASDPPAVHVNDEPPVNAGAKWKSARNGKRSGIPL